MHPQGTLSGGWNETHTYVIPIYVICCVALFPAKSMVPPYSASLHRLRHPMFESLCFYWRLFWSLWVLLLFLPLYLCLPSGLLCRPCPTSWIYKYLFVFSSSVSLLSSFFLFCFLAFRLVLSCPPSVGPSPRHIIGLIVPANSNRVPSGLGLRPARMHKVFRFGFLSFLFFSSFSFLPFFALFCRSLFKSPF